MCLLLPQLGGRGALPRTLAVFLSRLGQQSQSSPSSLLSSWAGHEKCKGVKQYKFHSRVRLTHTPALHLLSLAITSGRSRQWGWDGEGAGARVLVQDLLCSVGTHTRVGSETSVKEPFKGLLSARTQQCVPDSQVQATSHPPCMMGRGTGPSSPGGHKIYTPVRISLHNFPEGGQDSSGCHVAP